MIRMKAQGLSLRDIAEKLTAKFLASEAHLMLDSG
jgi:hypothetical protein